MTETKMYKFWYLLTFAVICTFYLSELVEMSMYIDGVWYASISRNLSIGKGSFWFPQFSETIFASFHEHPPLMFWLQSFFFKVLGDNFLTERIFNLTIYIINAILLLSFWRLLLPGRSIFLKTAFLPLLLWQFNIAAYFYFSANLLESQMIIFSGFAVLLLMKAETYTRPNLLIILSGILLFSACLTKGVVGLFPLASPFLLWLLFRRYSFPVMLRRSALLGASLLTCFALLLFLVPAARSSLSEYLDVQLFASLSGERRLYYYRDNRLFILGQMFRMLLPMLLLTAGTVFVLLRKAKQKSLTKLFHLKAERSRYTVFFLLTALSASLPIMLSPRQALPYLLPALSFFAPAFALYIYGVLCRLWEYIFKEKRLLRRVAEITASILLLISLSLCVFKYKKTNHRDAAVIHDAKVIESLVGKGTNISSAHYDMYISGYLMRFGNISLDTLDRTREYLLLPKDKHFPREAYRQIPANTKLFNLFQRDNNDYTIGLYDSNTGSEEH